MKFSLLVVALGLTACRRDEPVTPPPVPRAPDVAPVAPTAPACTLAPIALRLPMPKRLVAIGDLHGDIAAMRSVFKLAGAIDDKDTWIGGDLVIVQTGDILDRGDDEQAMLDLVTKLEPEAKAAGGALIMLLGNHELMNAAGDFRYVTPGAMSDFDDVPGLDTTKWQRAPQNVRGRIAALGPGGPYAKLLAKHNVIAIVGDTLFAHAGVTGAWVAQVDAVNQSSRCWLDGQAGGVEAVVPAMSGQDSPVWTRAYGGDRVDCVDLAATNRKLGIKRQVVGHTVQKSGVNGTCDDAIWRIDVGLAKGYGGPIEILELTPDAPPKVLRGTR